MLWRTVLADMAPDVVPADSAADVAADSAAEKATCLPWLLERELFSLTKLCRLCGKSSESLLIDNIELVVYDFTEANPCCQNTGNFPFHGAYMFAPSARIQRGLTSTSSSLTLLAISLQTRTSLNQKWMLERKNSSPCLGSCQL